MKLTLLRFTMLAVLLAIQRHSVREGEGLAQPGERRRAPDVRPDRHG